MTPIHRLYTSADTAEDRNSQAFAQICFALLASTKILFLPRPASLSRALRPHNPNPCLFFGPAKPRFGLGRTGLRTTYPQLVNSRFSVLSP